MLLRIREKSWDLDTEFIVQVTRVPTMKKYADGLGAIKGETKWKEISDILQETMVTEKNITPISISSWACLLPHGL